MGTVGGVGGVPLLSLPLQYMFEPLSTSHCLISDVSSTNNKQYLYIVVFSTGSERLQTSTLHTEGVDGPADSGDPLWSGSGVSQHVSDPAQI